VNGLTYAYLGDAVYELYIRRSLVDKGMTRINVLHSNAVKYTNAKFQAKAMKYLLEKEILSEKEISLYKLGRNSQARQAKKTASMIEYKLATGLESLIGYLYLSDESRLSEIVKIILGIEVN